MQVHKYNALQYMSTLCLSVSLHFFLPNYQVLLTCIFNSNHETTNVIESVIKAYLSLVLSLSLSLLDVIDHKG